jgi:hypothetical protein
VGWKFDGNWADSPGGFHRKRWGKGTEKAAKNNKLIKFPWKYFLETPAPP